MLINVPNKVNLGKSDQVDLKLIKTIQIQYLGAGMPKGKNASNCFQSFSIVNNESTISKRPTCEIE